jgi:periplasmic protein TonB
VKFIRQNPTLSIALAFSVLVHGLLLGVRFVVPTEDHIKSLDPGMEVILVNAKQDKPPVANDTLAQANLDGGGNAKAGRSKSPMPNVNKFENAENVQASKRRIDLLEQRQQRVLSQLNKQTALTTPLISDVRKKEDAAKNGTSEVERNKALARQDAEIAKNIEDYNKRPKKTQISPSSREAGYALYYKALQDKVEKTGTNAFPMQNGKKLYGELVVYIPVFQDGTIYTKEGGARVEHSSGSAALDRAALRIVEQSAPFDRFPANMRSKNKDDVWEVITHFKFTREEGLEAELRGGAR